MLICWCLFLAPATAAGEGPALNPREEAALFSLKDLGPVDLSVKTVLVEIYVSPDSQLAAAQQMMPGVWARVEAFYARLGVNLVQVPGQTKPGPVAPARRLRLELLPHREWLNRTYHAFKVEPPFRLRFLQVCRDKFAFAHLPLSVVHVSFKKFQEAAFSSSPKEAGRNRDWLANLVIHELGHLMGLYHAHEFNNDPIPEYLPDGRTPNFMSHLLTEQRDVGFVELQRRLVHSYLGGGKVFRQYRYVDFDPLQYLELIKRHNGYCETPEQKAGESRLGKVAYGQGKIKTFDGEDDEDDEDDD